MALQKHVVWTAVFFVCVKGLMFLFVQPRQVVTEATAV